MNQAGTEASTCFGSLSFGTYYVHESGAPTGYALAADQTATINANSTCAGSPVTKSFTDVPLSEIQVKFKSLAGTGVTAASIVCSSGGVTVDPVSENGAADPAYDDTDETITNLAPGTYTCTVVVDP